MLRAFDELLHSQSAWRLPGFRAYGTPVEYLQTTYTPTQRFDQHKARIRSAGSVLERGLEVLAGPTMRLQSIGRDEAERVEARLAGALADAGIRVEGGH